VLWDRSLSRIEFRVSSLPNLSGATGGERVVIFQELFGLTRPFAGFKVWTSAPPPPSAPSPPPPDPRIETKGGVVFRFLVGCWPAVGRASAAATSAGSDWTPESRTLRYVLCLVGCIVLPLQSHASRSRPVRPGPSGHAGARASLRVAG
jgi:hypothetical protein